MTRNCQELVDIGLLITLDLCIAGAVFLAVTGRETPEFVRAVAYSITAALCTRFVLYLLSRPAGNNH